MINDKELLSLLESTETYRIEKTISTTNIDKFCEAVCAFANDMPNSGKNGYLLIGVNDDGSRCGLKVNDELLKRISSIRTDGNILPLPVMNVDYVSFDDGDVVVAEVSPSILPPVRYRGRTFIRVGPRRDLATREEEDILTERRSCRFPTFDTHPCPEATIDDIDTDLFLHFYLPKAVREDAVRDESKTVVEQMAALRLYNLKYDCPTYAAIILFGKRPEYFLAGDYIQYVRFEGRDNAADISNQFEFRGNLCTMLPKLETFLETSLIRNRPVAVSMLKEDTLYNYPRWAVRELLMNAVMHRDYHSNTPTKLYQYSDRLEIVNAGGLYGNARPENFPTVNDYRNPIIAEAMKILGYVNMFNRGVDRVQHLLEQNGNGRADFRIDRITVFGVNVPDADVEPESSLIESPMAVTSGEIPPIFESATDSGMKTTIKTGKKTTIKTGKKTTIKPGAKTENKILNVIGANPYITMVQLADICGISINGVAWQINKLKRIGVLKREGGKRGGRWVIVE